MNVTPLPILNLRAPLKARINAPDCDRDLNDVSILYLFKRCTYFNSHEDTKCVQEYTLVKNVGYVLFNKRASVFYRV